MKVTIYGVGYVGLVTGACLADSGHDVLCVDIDASKIADLNAGLIPIHEPELEAMVDRCRNTSRLRFTSDAREGVAFAKVQMIAVGTPPASSGASNLSYVLNVARTIGRYMSNDKIVVTKSTVPVGTAERVEETVYAALGPRSKTLNIEVVSNPEFLREGSAVSDFIRPDRIVIGTGSSSVAAIMEELYEPFNGNGDRMILMDARSSELTKYAANAMLATKISFINEMANLAESLGVDIENIKKGIGSDPRIGPAFIDPSCGFGGSCLPKDVRALQHMAQEQAVPLCLIDAVAEVNQKQRYVLFDKIVSHFGGPAQLAGRRFAVWGLAFKSNTDDIRMSPGIALVEALLAAGGLVQAYDPAASAGAKHYFQERHDFVVMNERNACLFGADALVVCTEWDEFKELDFDQLHERLSAPVVFDGRNLLDPDHLAKMGVTYYGIGRGASCRIPGNDTADAGVEARASRPCGTDAVRLDDTPLPRLGSVAASICVDAVSSASNA